MATEWISPTWRMPEESNQSKFENYSLDFDGSSQDIDTNLTFNTLTSFSISAWFKADDTAGTVRSIVSTRVNGLSTSKGLDIYISANVLTARVYDNGATEVTQAFTDTSNWHNVVMTYNGTTLELFLDNSSVGTATGSYNNTGGRNLTIGKWGPVSATNYYFNGKITEVSIFDYVLSTDQINYLYNSGTPQNPMAISGNAPIAYYPLGGSSTGSASTLTVPNESVPSATVFEFDGPNANEQYITTTYFPNGESNFTYSTWVNCNFYQRGTLIAAYGGSTHQNFLITFWTSTGGVLYVYVGAGVYAQFNNFTFHGYSINEWTNISIVYDGTFTDADSATQNAGRLKLYINGNYEAFDSFVGTIPSTIPSGNTGFYLGTTTPTTYEYGGKMSNVQMWNTTLSAPNVATLYNNGVPLLTGTQPQAANLKAWYKMNVDTSTWNGSDWEIGDARSSYTSSINTTSRAFRTSTTALSDFMGSSVTNFTWSMWVRNTSGDTGSSSLVSWSYPGSSSYKDGIHQWYGNLSLWGSAVNKILFGSINDGLWKHVLIAVDLTAGSTWDDCVKCFINGQPRAMTSSTGTPPTSMDWTAGGTNQRDIGVGVGYIVSHSFHGDISNYTLYNSTLGQTEATALYNNGTPVTTAVGSPTAWWKINNLTTGLEDISGNSYNIEQWGTTQVVVDGLVSALNGESSGMTTANLVNSDLTRSIPYSSYSMDLDGAADYIDCGTSAALEIAGDISISAWVYITTGSIYNSIIAKRDSGGTNYQLYTDNSATPKLRFYDGSTATSSTGTVSLNAWHHIAITIDSGVTDGSIFYIDGVASGTATFTITSDDANLLIGALDNGSIGSYFTGSLSNTAVFDSVLSQDQILTIYNGGVPNNISSLSPVGWWSLAGDSYYNGSDWICPDLGSGGNNGTSSGMGGTELIGNGPGSTANGIATSMDIPENLKGNAPNSSKNAFSVNMNSADRLSGITNIPGTDSDVLSFLSSASITNTTQQTAINNLVLGLKNYGIWDKMKVIYPFVGGTDVSHSYNLKDTTVAQITWTSGVTHNSDGVQGKYGDTGVTPAALGLGRNDASLGFYTQNGWQLNQSFSLGVFQGSDSLAFYKAGGAPGTIFIMINNYLTTVSTTMPATQAGFHQASRTLSTEVSYKKDNSTVVSVSGNSAQPPESVYNLWINQANGYSSGYGGITSLAYFGLGLTDTQLDQMNTLITAYQTTLGRQV